MRLSLNVTYDDARPDVRVTAKPKDMVAFERQYEHPTTDLFEPGARDEWFFYLAWSVLHRSKQEPRAFDEFLDDVDSITVVNEEAPAAPFPTAPSGELSPGSPAEPAFPSTP